MGVGNVSAACRNALMTRAPRRWAGSSPKPERSRQRLVLVSMSLQSRLSKSAGQGYIAGAGDRRALRPYSGATLSRWLGLWGSCERIRAMSAMFRYLYSALANAILLVHRLVPLECRAKYCSACRVEAEALRANNKEPRPLLP
jgi:hypothetical protein